MLTDFLSWWRDTLQACVPPSWHRPQDSPKIVIKRAGLALVLNDDVQPIEAYDIEAAARLAAEGVAAAHRAALVVALEPGRFVLRKLSPARLPASRVRAMASFDLESATPFATSDVRCFVLRPVDETRPSPTAYAIVKRNVIDPIVEALRSVSVPIAGVVFLPAQGEDQIWALSTGDLAELNKTPSWRRNFPWITVTVIMLASAATFAHLSSSYSLAQTQVDETLPALERKAKAVRDELNRRSARMAEIKALRRNLAAQRPMAEVLEEIARVLPDSAYLTDLSIKDGSASLVGFGQSASAIIAPLEGSPMLKGAEFASPVVKIPGQDGERFDITLNVLSR
ncbi:MAG: hypothetical protein EOR72_20460 [Mesorhizobium sp.]|nr:MAG: hypothetical protein EOR72_20460 [Mesorhizobium sp.]